eukprot:scaffold59361_cov98-Phaeocystis_antarctica.AAC.2
MPLAAACIAAGPCRSPERSLVVACFKARTCRCHHVPCSLNALVLVVKNLELLGVLRYVSQALATVR